MRQIILLLMLAGLAVTIGCSSPPKIITDKELDNIYRAGITVGAVAAKKLLEDGDTDITHIKINAKADSLYRAWGWQISVSDRIAK